MEGRLSGACSEAGYLGGAVSPSLFNLLNLVYVIRHHQFFNASGASPRLCVSVCISV